MDDNEIPENAGMPQIMMTVIKKMQKNLMKILTMKKFFVRCFATIPEKNLSRRLKASMTY